MKYNNKNDVADNKLNGIIINILKLFFSSNKIFFLLFYYALFKINDTFKLVFALFF